MRIMVFDVPAESGGALSVLNDYYNESINNDKNKYFFVVSKPKLQETENIKILRFPWIKKSWFHRLYFEHVIAPRLIKKHEIDSVLSLQNIIIAHTNIFQTVFIHNALPFSEYKFSFRANKYLWFYQNIIGINILKSIKKADHVIVQTNWMKEKCVDKLQINGKKIEVRQPKVDIKINREFQKTKESFSTFFYPASGVVFKNHKVVVDACLELKKDGINKYSVIFTLRGDENEHIVELYNIAKENKLPIDFIGSLTRKEVFEFYSKSILIFPSYIETVGLPLLEAKLHRTPIFVSDCDFSREILFGSEKINYFNCFSSKQVSELMKDSIMLAEEDDL